MNWTCISVNEIWFVSQRSHQLVISRSNITYLQLCCHLPGNRMWKYGRLPQAKYNEVSMRRFRSILNFAVQVVQEYIEFSSSLSLAANWQLLQCIRTSINVYWKSKKERRVPQAKWYSEHDKNDTMEIQYFGICKHRLFEVVWRHDRIVDPIIWIM